MFTSSDAGAVFARRRHTASAAISFGFAALFILFGGVYEYFSFGVWSFYMVYAFVPAFLSGIWHFVRLIRTPENYYRYTAAAFHSSAACLTVGSVFAGVLEIYGTTSNLIPVLFIAAAVFAAAGIVFAILKK